MTRALFILLCCLSLHGATVTINSNALVAFPKRGEWYGLVNNKPGNGDTVYQNPPIVSWSYTPDPADSETNIAEYVFGLEISTNASFSTLDVSVGTRFNTYNFLAPLRTNVIYYKRTRYTNVASSAASIGVTDTFTVATSATNWDRSMLADTNFLATRVHPYMEWNSTNRADHLNYRQTNDAGATWNSWVSLASGVTNASWTTNAWESGLFSGYADRCLSLWIWSKVWGLDQDPKWTNYLCSAYDNFVIWYRDTSGLAYAEFVGLSHVPLLTFALGYDTLYPIMSSGQRTNAIASISTNCYNLDRSLAFVGYSNQVSVFPLPPTGYAGPWYSQNPFLPKIGSAHSGFSSMAYAMLGLAAFNDSPAARAYMEGHLNYFLGKGTYLATFGGTGSGRNYIFENTLNQGYISMLSYFNNVFPDLQMSKIEHWQSFADFWSRMNPPGYREAWGAWGDTVAGLHSWDNYQYNIEYLSGITGSGEARMHMLNECAIQGLSSAEIRPFGISQPAPATNLVLGRLFPEDGWVIGSTRPPNAIDAYTNGVGFIFKTLPKGFNEGHSHYNSGSFEMWAYGSHTTVGGGNEISYYAHTPLAHNCLFINGNSVFYDNFPHRGTNSYFSAFTNHADFMFSEADLTYDFPHEAFSFTSDNGNLIAHAYGDSVPALTYIQSVKRAALFVRDKGWVLFRDSFATATNSTFSGLFHMVEDTNAVVFTNNGVVQFKYLATNNITGYVTNYAFFLTPSNEITFTQQRGTNCYINPDSGADFNLYLGSSAPAYRSAVNWWKLTAPATSGTNVWGIYTVKPGEALPTFTRLDRWSVQVDAGAYSKKVSYNSASADSPDYLVDLAAAGGGGSPTGPRIFGINARVGSLGMPRP